jgi:hypothetical protein
MVNSQDIQLVDYYMSECQKEHNYHWEQDRISQINQLDSGLTEIVLSVIGNCGMTDSISISKIENSLYFYYDLPEVFVKNKSYFLNDTTYIEEETIIFQGYTACNCCFTFNITLKGFNHSADYKFIANDEEIPFTEHRFPIKPISFEIFEGDTINYRNLYGFMQGRWILRNDKGLITEDAIYENGYIVNGKTDKKYNYGKRLISEREERLIETEEGYRRVYSELFYYPSGNLKRKCVGLFPKEREDFPDEPIE